MPRHAALLLLCLPLLAAETRAGATQPARHLRGLAAQADIVALATCESAESRWDPDHRFIVTRSTVRLDRSFKGDPAHGTITVDTLGGRVGDVGMGASHAATLSAGETSVLFLRRARGGAAFIVWGGDRGKLPVHRRSDGRLAVGRPDGTDLDAFAAMIDAAERRP